jgi:uncharacterized protein (TIGR02147 family)
MMETHLILQKYFRKKKASQKNFTLRSLAQKLELSASFVSRVLSGQKAIPYWMLLRLRSTLDIEPEVFLSLKKAHSDVIEGETIPTRGKVRIKTEIEDWELANNSSFNILRQWFYLAILEFTTLANYDGSTDLIADRLGLSTVTVEIALREMLSLGLIKTVDGKFVKTRKKLRWSTTKSQSEVRRFHDQMLAKAQLELRKEPSESAFARRFISGITLTTSPEKIEAAHKKLNDCLHEIANDLTDEQGTEVFHLAAQLFPLTKASSE